MYFFILAGLTLKACACVNMNIANLKDDQFCPAPVLNSLSKDPSEIQSTQTKEETCNFNILKLSI